MSFSRFLLCVLTGLSVCLSSQVSPSNVTDNVADSVADGLLRECWSSTSFSCVQNGLRKALETQLSADFDVTDSVRFVSNGHKYSWEANRPQANITENIIEDAAPDEDEHADDEHFHQFVKAVEDSEATDEGRTQTASESESAPKSSFTHVKGITDILYNRGVHYLMTHDLNIDMPEFMFGGGKVRVQPRSIEEDGGVVIKLNFDEPEPPEKPEGRIFLKKLMTVLKPGLVVEEQQKLIPKLRRGGIVPAAIAVCILWIFLSLILSFYCDPTDVRTLDRAYGGHTNVIVGKDGQTYQYNRSSPVIFISGVNHSGSGVLRYLLNHHPQIRCTRESYVIPWLLSNRIMWFGHKKERKNLVQAGVGPEVLDTAIASFILEILAGSGEPAKYLCNKDFHSVKFAEILSATFPESKFLLVVRDPLHYAHMEMNTLNRKSFNETLFQQHLEKWNKEMTALDRGCNQISAMGFNRPRCKIVGFEQLVLRPTSVISAVLNFIFNNDSHIIPETMNSFLYPGKNGDLLEWLDNVPKRSQKFIGNISMANRFGYGTLGYPPNYNLLRGGV